MHFTFWSVNELIGEISVTFLTRLFFSLLPFDQSDFCHYNRRLFLLDASTSRHPYHPHSSSVTTTSLMKLASLAFLLASAIVASAAEPATLSAPAPPRLVAVVYGEKSCFNPQGSQYAFSRARSVFRDLDDLGVTAKLYPDSQLAEALAPPSRVVHLVCCDMPPSSQLQLLGKFLASGGKLVVHYSSSPDLAKLMGLTAPKIIQASTEPWAKLKFVENRPSNAPLSVENRVLQVIETLPRRRNAQVLARWIDADGNVGPAAVVKSPRGFWLTRLVMDDGDSDRRKELFASLTADCDVNVWRYAAKRMENEIWKTVHATSLDDAKRQMRRSVPAAKRDILEEYFASMDYTIRYMHADFEKGLFAAAMQKIWDLKDTVKLAYAVANKIKIGTGVLAVWEKSGVGLFPGDWNSTATLLSKAGVTDIYLMTASLGFSNTRVPGLAQSWMFKKYGDQTAAAVKACHRYGIRVHAWIPALILDDLSTAQKQAFVKQGRGLVNSRNQPVFWGNPADPRNREEIARIAVWIAKNTGVDGIHLDYIRYPLEESAMGTQDRANFEKWMGKKVRNWPTDVQKGGTLRPQYTEWRNAQVSGMVRLIRQRLKASSPRTLLSTAMYGAKGGNNVGQDWQVWLRDSLVDYIVPMNYSQDLPFLQKLLDWQTGCADRSKIVCGIGATSYEAALDSVEVLEQINTAAKYGIKGVSLYHLDHRCQVELLPALQLAK